jgi:competence protein ComEC
MVLVALLPAAVLSALAAVRAQRIIWLPVAVLWCFLGAWCAEMEPQPAPAPELRALSDGLLRTVEGTVIDAGPVRGQIEQDLDPASAAGKAQRLTQRIDLRVGAIEKVTDDEDAKVPAAGDVRLTVRWPGAPDLPFRCGERARAVARLLPPDVYRDPGAWSREDYLLGQGITATATVDVGRVERLGSAPDAIGVSGPWRQLWSRLSAAASAKRSRQPARGCWRCRAQHGPCRRFFA